MNIGIVTIAYNGYGRFLKQWCQSIANLKEQPAAVTVLLGLKHGCEDVTECLELLPSLKVVYTNKDPNMGKYRNLAVSSTDTEWIMYLSIDDVIKPDAIRILKQHEDTADYICITWASIATWEDNPIELTHYARTPKEIVLKYNTKGFIVGHSPFRKSFWENNPYMEHDYPNAPFVAGLVEAGARFAKTTEPCTLYLRRLDSHAARLGRRKSTLVRSEKAQANHWKRDMMHRLQKYYN